MVWFDLPWCGRRWGLSEVSSSSAALLACSSKMGSSSASILPLAAWKTSSAPDESESTISWTDEEMESAEGNQSCHKLSSWCGCCPCTGSWENVSMSGTTKALAAAASGRMAKDLILDAQWFERYELEEGKRQWGRTRREKR